MEVPGKGTELGPGQREQRTGDMRMQPEDRGSIFLWNTVNRPCRVAELMTVTWKDHLFVGNSCQYVKTIYVSQY